MNNRNTKQKQIIMDVLDKNRTHPTIKEIQEKVKEIDASIGQATIYRNINKLVDEEKIKKIPTAEGRDHYDINTVSHYHFICQKCGKIMDLFDKKYEKLINRMETDYQMKIENSNIIFEGVCKECLNEKV